MENYKMYIDTDKPSVKIKFSISYLKPSESHNWATGEFRKTGYRITGVPVERSADGRMESFTAFTGFGDTLLSCERRSQKRYEQAIEIFEDRVLKYLEHFQSKGIHICKDAINELIEQKEHRNSRNMKKPTKKQYEEHLNSISPAQDSGEWIIGGVPRFYFKYLNQYGTALRKYDKVFFDIGYNEFVLSKINKS